MTIYTSNTCSICKAVKSRMTARNIPYTERNTSTDDEARDYLVREGFRSVPVVVHGNTPYGSPDAIMQFIKQY